MHKFLLTFIASLLIVIANAQTNVSGGIYTNTTWALANSPYVVVDTVVVFPGVTLTIEPGVEVRFDNNKQLEIRQSNIFAEGTITDSITFTSNSSSPAPGLYSVFLNNYPMQTVSRFNYCNFRYGKGLYDLGVYDSLTVCNSNFTYNTVGLQPIGGYVRVDSCNFSNNTDKGVYKLYGTMNFCTISNNQTGIYSPTGIVQNCTIENNQIGVNCSGITILSSKINYNQTGVISIDDHIKIDHCIIDSNTVKGISLLASGYHTIENCEIKYNNGTGLELDGQQSRISMCNIENNLIGFKENGSYDTITCNTICNNSSYNFYCAGSNNISVINNNWCSNDSATVKSHIYDGYVDISKGLVYITPFDTIGCYLVNDIPITADEISVFMIYPNPTTNDFTVKNISSNKTSVLQIINIVGEVVYTEKLFGKNECVVHSNLSTGIYFVSVSDERRNAVKKLIVE